jgi:hypothetical protein
MNVQMWSLDVEVRATNAKDAVAQLIEILTTTDPDALADEGYLNVTDEFDEDEDDGLGICGFCHEVAFIADEGICGECYEKVNEGA